MANIVLSNLRSLFERYKKDIHDVSQDLFLDWADEINRFCYRIIYKGEPEQFITTSTISVVANDDSYTLPADYLTMDTTGCGLFPVYNSLPSQTPLTRTSYGSKIQGYYINQGSIYLTPVPQQSATVILRYIPTIAQLTSMSDTMIIPDQFIYYARNAMDCLYDMWAEDPSAEGLADQRFARSLDELARNLRKDTGVYGLMQDNSAYYDNY